MYHHLRLSHSDDNLHIHPPEECDFFFFLFLEVYMFFSCGGISLFLHSLFHVSPPRPTSTSLSFILLILVFSPYTIISPHWQKNWTQTSTGAKRKEKHFGSRPLGQNGLNHGHFGLVSVIHAFQRYHRHWAALKGKAHKHRLVPGSTSTLYLAHFSPPLAQTHTGTHSHSLITVNLKQVY